MVRVGIGGWSYAPWRGLFYPKGLKQADELKHAAERLTMIEINATYYRNQSRASFARWREATPPGFVFSVKGSRFVTNQRKLGEAGESARRFLDSGLDELGDKLGPVLWQLPPWKRFGAEEIDAFLGELPRVLGKLPLRHALEVRHESFRCAEYLEVARKRDVATVFTDSDEYPSFADRSGGFVYARLMRTRAELEQGYPDEELDAWAKRARAWAAGESPPDLPMVAPAGKPVAQGQVFVVFISGAKERAPAAAEALIARVA